MCSHFCPTDMSPRSPTPFYHRTPIHHMSLSPDSSTKAEGVASPLSTAP